MCVRDLAAQFARGLLFVSRPRKQRAQGRPDARCTRGLVCISHNKMRTRAYRSSGEHPAFPAQWFYGLCRALPGETNSFATNAGGILPARLTPVSGRRNHTILPYAPAALVSRSLRVHRISTHVRDDSRSAPLVG